MRDGLKEKSDLHDNNVEQQKSLKTEIEQEIFHNKGTSRDVYLEEGMERQLIVKNDNIFLEEKKIQPIEYFCLPKIENNESVIISSNIKEELEENSDKHDNNVEQLKSIKIEVIENNETSGEVHSFVEPDMQKQVLVEEDIIVPLRENNIQPIDNAFFSEIKNNESVIRNCNVGEELEEKYNKHENNFDEQSMKIEIIKQTNDNNNKNSKDNNETTEAICFEEKRRSIRNINSKFHLVNDKKKSLKVSTDSGTSRTCTVCHDLKCQSLLRTDLGCKKDLNDLLQCKQYDEPFKNKLDLHINESINNEIGTAEKRFPCNKCEKTFTGLRRYNSHLRIHSTKKRKRYVCGRCRKRFIKRSTLVDHIRKHTGHPPYICNICDKKFPSSWYLKFHLRNHSGEKKYECNQCGKKFTHRMSLIEHIRIHTGKTCYVCDQCSKKYNSLSSLLRHFPTHTKKKRYVCDHCSKTFAQQRGLVTHIRTHTGEKPYVCDHCSKRFAKRNWLVRHIRIHTGEKPYVCNDCSMRFARQGDLVKHIRIHTGEKPYICVQCNKRFNDQSNLVRHIRTHTGEKSYACDQCTRRFVERSDLVKHIRIHTGEKPYACNHCSMRFNRQSNLVKHIRSHIPKKANVCDQCNKIFKHHGHLLNHIRKHTENGSIRSAKSKMTNLEVSKSNII